MSDLPSVDALLGPEPRKPMPDEILGAPPPSVNQMALGGADMDEYFSQGSAGALLDTFGQGVKNGWGDQPLGVSKENEDWMRKAGIWNDYDHGSRSFWKTLNEAVMRPAAAALDAASRAPMALYHGFGDLAEQAGVPRDIIGIPEAFPAGHATGFPTLPPTPQALAQARALGVVGEGEAGWKGTVEPAPDAETARAEAVKSAIAQEEPITAEAMPSPEATAQEATSEPAPAPLPDIHTVARQIAPDTFSEYDALNARKETFRRWLDDLGEGRSNSDRAKGFQDQIDTILGRVNGVEGRLTKSAADRLQAARDGLDEYLRTDTPDMQRVRHDLQQTDLRMRDLAPDVSAAYREAQARMPAPEPAQAPEQAQTPPESAPAPEPQAAAVQAPETLPTLTVTPEAPATPVTPESSRVAAVEAQNQPQLPLETQTAAAPSPAATARPPVEDIAADVAGKLAAAGRPAEEAQAAAALVQAHYEARAARFGGAKGTPQEMYAADGPEITGGPAGRAHAAGKTVLGDGRATISLFAKADASTFIHETGHQWLDELMRDAADSAAPADLAKDAGAVRAWLGADETAELTRRQHEKFARGFERYMMEGHAPSSALADVFAKFKDWLTNIYQTVSRLRSPINDDIRGVFDRLLSAPSPEQAAVIAPDREMVTPAHRANRSVYEPVPIEPRRLSDFLRREGGLQDQSGEISHILGGKNQRPGLINRRGKTLDDAALRAWEEGYFPEHGENRPTINDLLDAIRDDVSGIPRYSAQDKAMVEAYRNALAKNADIDRIADALGIDPRDYSREQFFDLAAEHLSKEEQAREIGSLDAEAERELAEAEAKAKEWVESRGDAWEPDLLYAGTAARSLEDLEDAYKQEAEAARNPSQSPRGNELPELATADQGSVQTGAGQVPGGFRPTGRTGTPIGEPETTNDVIRRSDGRFIDKAGNIRLDNLNTPEDISAVLRQTSDENAEFWDQRRGVLSDAEVLDLSEALGMSPSSLDRRKIGEAFNAEQIVAARKLLIQSATAVRDAMTLAANGTDAEVMAYASAKARHQMIQAQVAGITAEAGRALRAFRSLEGMKEAEALGDFLAEATGQTLYQLRSEAIRGATLDTPLKVSKFIQDATKPGFGEMVLEYWINGLISGPATHTTYMVGNALLSMWKMGAETPAAATIGAIRQAFGGDAARVRFGEVPAQAYGLMRGLRQGIVAGWESAKSGLTTALPEEAVDVMTPTQRARYDAARTGGKTHDQAILDVLGLKGDVPTQYAFGKKEAIPDFHIGSIPIPLGTAIRLPGRGVAMIHSFFRAVNYEREMAALAYRTAASEGLDGEAMAARIADVTANPSTEMMQDARRSATDLTLMGKGGELTQALSRLTNAKFLGFRWLKFIDPFVHIGSNVIEQAILQRTPAGWLDPKIRADLMGVNGTIARDVAAARMIAGSTLAVAAGSLAAEGLLTGSEPEDPKEAAAKRLTGWQAHSIRVGEMYYDVHRLGPLGMLLGVSADLYEVGHAAGKEDTTKVAHMLSHAFSQNILDESFMRGPAELIRAIEEPDRYGQRYVQQLMASFIPYSVGMSQAARAIDPYSRQARTTMDAVKAKVPFASEMLFPRRDVWGQPIPNKDVLGIPGLSAIYESKINNDPVNLALVRLGVFPGQIERRVRGIELTEQQYDDLSRIAGRTAKMQLDQFVGSPGFSRIPDAAQREIIGKTISSAREAARTLVMMQSVGHENDIVKKAVEAKRAQANGSSPADVREMRKLH